MRGRARSLGILAHRGASASHPENTLQAFRVALRPADRGGEGASGVELDVRLSSDGVPVIFHDDDTERLTGAPGTIESRTLQEIATLRVGDESIPTLAEALDLIVQASPGLGLGSVNVELKPTGASTALIHACAPLLAPLASSPRAPLVVSSFDPRVILTIQEAGLNWRLALIYDHLSALRALPTLESSGPIDLHPCHRLLDSDHVATYGRPDRWFRTWTIDDPVEASRVRDLHPSICAVITNRPGAIRGALERP